MVLALLQRPVSGLARAGRPERVGRVLLGIGLVIIVLAAFVPSTVTAAYLHRFTLPEVSLSGNFFNRGLLYRTSWSLIGGMPILGYGANMMTIFQQRFMAP